MNGKWDGARVREGRAQLLMKSQMIGWLMMFLMKPLREIVDYYPNILLPQPECDVV